MSFKKRFGEELKRARRSKVKKFGRKFHADQMADEIGVSKTAFSNWETGKHFPHIKELEKIMELLDMDIVFVPKGLTYDIDYLQKVAENCPELGSDLMSSLLYFIRVRKRELEKDRVDDLGNMAVGKLGKE